MVYTLSDLPHLKLMTSLDESPAIEKASIKEDIKQDNTSLSGSILTLANKLRASGFDKYAMDIEQRLVVLQKTAASLHIYKTHKEDGEALLHAAHPEGDVHMADAADGNGDVETLSSRHKKIVDIVQKMPTGKLAAYVEQCKIVLGFDTENINNLYAQATNALNKFRSLYDKMVIKSGEKAGNNDRYFDTLVRVLDDKKVYESNIPNFASSLVDTLDNFKSAQEPSTFWSSLNPLEWGKNQSEIVWKDILQISEIAMKYALSFKSVITKISSLEKETHKQSVQSEFGEDTAPAAPAIENITGSQALLNEIEQYHSAAANSKSPNKTQQLQWLESMNEFVTRNKDTLTSEQMTEIKKRLDAFKNVSG